MQREKEGGLFVGVRHKALENQMVNTEDHSCESTDQLSLGERC